MKRFTSPVVLIGLVYGGLLGNIVGLVGTVAAQQPAQGLQARDTLYWSSEAVQQLHAALQQRVAKGEKPNTAELVALPPGMRLNHRIPGDMADTAESHDNVTDFFVIVAGSGVVGIGGEIENKRSLQNADGPVPGEYRGWPVKNGVVQSVKAGDWVHLPPRTAHWARADPGGLTFLLIKVNH